MEEKRIAESFLKTHILDPKGVCLFFVSTIYRESSASIDPAPWYYETFGWSIDENGKQKDIIADNSGARFKEKALAQHAEVVKQLTTNGRFINPEDED